MTSTTPKPYGTVTVRGQMMNRTMCFLAMLLTAVACTSNDPNDAPKNGSATGMDTGAATDTAGDPDTAPPSDTGAAPGIPDWVDPEVPEGPIAPPDGSGTDPEDTDFDWNGIDGTTLADTFPSESLSWTAYPQYGTARILEWSDSETCVCFDAECATCNAEDCSTETCTYDLNDQHALTKYHIEMRATDYAEHTLSFEVNISANPPLALGIEDALARLERIPVEYWYGLRVITEFGHGIQFLHASYFAGGAAAYGGMNYIDTRTVDLPVLLHELGHTLEQYTRIGNAPTLEGQANILNPIWRNAIRSDNNRTSAYGNSNEWEDMAEFARIHAQCLIEGTLDDLEAASPERFRIWERILLNGTTINP